MTGQSTQRVIDDSPWKRRRRLVGALVAIAWPCLSYRFRSEPWIVPASIGAFWLIIRVTRSGNVLRYAVRGLAAAFVFSFLFMLPSLNSHHNDNEILLLFGLWTFGILLGVSLGIAADVGDRPDNPFRQSDEAKQLARRSPPDPN